MNCESCGLPMENPEDHGGQIPGNRYCKFCTDAEGNLKSRDQVRNGMINLMKSKGEKDAERLVDQYMQKMPAWSE